MPIAGVKQRLLCDVIRMLFGTTAARICEVLTEHAPCQLGFICASTGVAVNDVRTVALAMYVHGVVSIVQDGSKSSLILNSLPALVLSAPSILLDEIQHVYSAPSFVNVVHRILLNGIIEIPPPTDKASRMARPKDTPEFVAAAGRLFDDGLLMRRIVDFSSFSTDDVWSVERRCANLHLIRKCPGGSSAASSDEPAGPAAVAVEGGYTLSINWNGVATFLRCRFLVQSARSLLGESFVDLVQAILSITNAADYAPHRRLSQEPDDRMRGRSVPQPSIEVLKLLEVCGMDRNDIFPKLDTLAGSSVSLLRSGDGSYWFVTAPQAVRALQMQYIEVFAEGSLSPYHRRCLNQLHALKVAESHQIEVGALLSEKDARTSMYGLFRIGLVHMQSMPRLPGERSGIGPKTIVVWRYDETAAVEAYRTIIGEHARRFLARIVALL
jgi:hypothetical protein